MARKDVRVERRKELIEANIHCIARYGISETTVAHVSQAAGMSRGIVNFYFDSKDQMMLDTLQYLSNNYLDALRSAAEKQSDDAVDALKAVVRANFHPSICQPKRLSVWAAFCGQAHANPKYRKLINSFDGAHRLLVSELWAMILKNLGKKKKERFDFAWELHTMIRGLWMAFLLDQDKPERELMADRCVGFVEKQIQGLVLAGDTSQKEASEIRKTAIKKAAGGKKKKDGVETKQLDFEDLFKRATAAEEHGTRVEDDDTDEAA